MKKVLSAIAIASFVAFGVAYLPACAREGREAGSKADATPAVDAELLAYLSMARAIHHEANLDEAENKPEKAIVTLERLTHSKRPSAKFPEVGEVLADTHARLAELRLRAGMLDAALQEIREGRVEVLRGSYFDGHLSEVEGMIEEARSASLADAGKMDQAKEARELARAKLREAVRIQEGVMERALSDAGR